jgi:hypothetical protein
MTAIRRKETAQATFKVISGSNEMNIDETIDFCSFHEVIRQQERKYWRLISQRQRGVWKQSR